MNIRQSLMVAGSTFAGAAAGAISALPTSAFLSWPSAERALLGAVLTGVVAVIHLYEPKPGSPS